MDGGLIGEEIRPVCFPPPSRSPFLAEGQLEALRDRLGDVQQLLLVLAHTRPGIGDDEDVDVL